MPNPTALAFGYPRSKVAETDHWLVLVRPKQPTFGSLVLVCKEPVQAFSDLSPAAFADMQVAVAGIERVLKAKGASPINVIKEVRAITGLGLSEAKALVEGAPKPLKEGVNKAEAEEIKGKIEAAGGTVELK